jgi:hypothetical protein
LEREKRQKQLEEEGRDETRRIDMLTICTEKQMEADRFVSKVCKYIQRCEYYYFFAIFSERRRQERAKRLEESNK